MICSTQTVYGALMLCDLLVSCQDKVSSLFYRQHSFTFHSKPSLHPTFLIASYLVFISWYVKYFFFFNSSGRHLLWAKTLNSFKCMETAVVKKHFNKYPFIAEKLSFSCFIILNKKKNSICSKGQKIYSHKIYNCYN